MLKPGETIDIWVVEKALGAGGMGSVYRCHNRNARRILAAVKVLESSIRRVPGAEERFVREAEILFALDHPNIVKVRNIRTDSDPPYLEMEFIAGTSLEDVLRKGAPPFERSLSLIEQLLGAVSYLHSQGVRHRDIKPANVLVQDDGTLKLVDFGLAMEADTSRITQGTMAFGTVSYAPPEWVKPDTLDPMAWDAYACGVLAYEVLTGDVAFPVGGGGSARQQAMQVILAKQGHPPLDPGPTFSNDLRNLVGRLTDSDASKRLVDLPEAMRLLREVDRTRTRRVGQTLAPMPDEPVSELIPPAPTPVAPQPRDGQTWFDGEGPLDSFASASQENPVFERTAPSAPKAGGTFLLLALAATMVVLVLGVGAFVYTASQGQVETKVLERPAAVTVSGLPPKSDVSVRFRGIPPESREGWVFRFGTGPLGPGTVSVVVGADCPELTCPGSACPTWCATHEESVEIHEGDGEQSVSVEVAPPEARSVSVSAARGVSLVTRPEADLSAGKLMPARYEVLGSMGKCPEDPWTCVEEPCEGCTVEVADLVVPWKGEVVDLKHPLKPKKTAPSPGPVGPRPKASGGGGQITYGGFARWLANNPDWAPDKVRGTGRGDGNYLADWSGSEPPAGKSRAPMVNISWYAASAYCMGHGGLADVASAPETWGSGPSLELRSSGGRGAWRTSDGTTSTSVDLKQSNGFMGARCAK
ncbi:MAG: serine/threonine protein kinase [Proteobacteria bacterium]|nr:serine/threonine protein kinase [Pseudomonadota bacterium]